MTASADNTRVDPPATLTDSAGSVWSIDAQGWALRNGTRTNGHAIQILWHGGIVYVKSPTAPQHWWQWLGNNKWKDTGSSADPIVSADGTRVPDAAAITDATSAVWTLGGSAGVALRPILKNGAAYFDGHAIQLEYLNSNVYAFVSVGTWWLATANGWNLVPDPNASQNTANGITIDFTVTPMLS